MVEKSDEFCWYVEQFVLLVVQSDYEKAVSQMRTVAIVSYRTAI